MTPFELLKWCVVVSVAVPMLAMAFRFAVDMVRGDRDEEGTDE